ncbi:hypothetical protein LOAG_01588 [Loa loa]|uniref:Uncharacterized protein n=1 Tax=Loa loa TaxID=7209 RepID=A0A1S0U8L8_LOALO|nr:hypothetical protein LOAG_01588 [Loa loa]EFO26894.1 hypothetical protein LOAG_01588 [Loa loa]
MIIRGRQKFPACCPVITTAISARVRPLPRTTGVGLDECSILHHSSRGVCPQFVQLVYSRSRGTAISQVVIQIVSGIILVANNMGPMVAMLTIECVALRRWMYRDTQQKEFEFTGVSCNQGTLTSGD